MRTLYCGYCQKEMPFRRIDHDFVCTEGHKHPVFTADRMVAHKLDCAYLVLTKGADRAVCTCGAYLLAH